MSHEEFYSEYLSTGPHHSKSSEDLQMIPENITRSATVFACSFLSSLTMGIIHCCRAWDLPYNR
jgi:hypothetical protein